MSYSNVLIFQVINFYMKLLMDRFNDIFVFSTFFYTKLSSHGHHSVLSWHKGVDLFKRRMLLFPVHQVEHAHWCLVIADIPNKNIVSLDSLNKDNSTCLEILKNHLQELNSQSSFSVNQAKNLPQQYNSFDCGMFVCLYARCLAQRSAFNFTQADVAVFRKHMVLELVYKTIL